MIKTVQVVKGLVSELQRREQGINNYKNLPDFDEFFKSLQRLIKTQKSLHKKDEAPPTKYDFAKFRDWMGTNGFTSNNNFEIHNYEEQGNGLLATKDIKENEVIMEIPMGVMITEDTARKSKIEILPQKFDTPLYYSYEELVELTGSATLTECLKTIVSVLRNYCYLFKYFQEHPQLCSIISFTYADFIWAISCLMSRQNVIKMPAVPSKDGEGKQDEAVRSAIALIPLWDLANHSEGRISTNWVAGTQKVECTAMRTFKKGEQILIHYGDRTNLEFFLYSGFLYSGNKNDVINIRMSISDVETNRKAEKLEILNHLGYNNGEIYATLNGKYIPYDLIVFAAVLFLPDDNVANLKDKPDLVAQDCAVSFENGREFLHSKTSYWLGLYPTKIEEDQKLLEGNLSPHVRNAVLLRYFEKKIFQNTIELLADKSKDVKGISTNLEVKKVGENSKNSKNSKKSKKKTPPVVNNNSIEGNKTADGDKSERKAARANKTTDGDKSEGNDKATDGDIKKKKKKKKKASTQLDITTEAAATQPTTVTTEVSVTTTVTTTGVGEAPPN